MCRNFYIVEARLKEQEREWQKGDKCIAAVKWSFSRTDFRKNNWMLVWKEKSNGQENLALFALSIALFSLLACISPQNPYLFPQNAMVPWSCRTQTAIETRTQSPILLKTKYSSGWSASFVLYRFGEGYYRRAQKQTPYSHTQSNFMDWHPMDQIAFHSMEHGP